MNSNDDFYDYIGKKVGYIKTYLNIRSYENKNVWVCIKWDVTGVDINTNCLVKMFKGSCYGTGYEIDLSKIYVENKKIYLNVFHRNKFLSVKFKNCVVDKKDTDDNDDITYENCIIMD